MQLKAMKGLAKRVRRGVRRVFGHVEEVRVETPLPPFIDVVRDFTPPPPPLTLPASPRSGSSSEILTGPESVISQHRITTSDLESRTTSSGTECSSSAHPSSYPSAEESLAPLLTSKELHPTSRRLTTTAEVDTPQFPDVEPPTPETTGLLNVVAPSELAPSGKSMEESSRSPTPPDEKAPVIHEDIEESSVVSSPSPERFEPDPDSFLIDDPEDPVSDDENAIPLPSSQSLQGFTSEQSVVPPAEEISLAQPQSSEHSSPLLSSNIHKAVPPPPDSDDDDETPELYLPGLIIPTMFLPIPNTDPLTTLLTKYIFPPEKRPMRDVTGAWQQNDFHTLVMTNSWRALAKMARDRIVVAKPDDLALILGLWYLRLACLSRLRLFNQTSAECTNLFVVLNAVEPASARTYLFDRLLPFELEVMQARLKYWAGDHMAYLDALNMLLSKCRTKARLAKADAANLAMWRERGARICLIIASQLTEMKDFTAATNILEPLCNQAPGVSSPALRSAIARIYLQAGYIDMASKHFAVVAADPNAEQIQKDMNAALLASADGEWAEASEILTKLVAQDAENFAAVNNLSVALLSQGKLKEGIAVLETALRTSPSSVVVAEPFLFNLSTLYELHSATSAENKRELLIEVSKWSGDGLKITCLKMPSN